MQLFRFHEIFNSFEIEDVRISYGFEFFEKLKLSQSFRKTWAGEPKISK